MPVHWWRLKNGRDHDRGNRLDGSDMLAGVPDRLAPLTAAIIAVVMLAVSVMIAMT